MWFAPIEILLPFFQRLVGFAQCAKQRFFKAFIPHFAVEAFAGTVLLGLAGSGVVPINACALNLFEDCHASELAATVGHNLHWHATFSDEEIRLSNDAMARKRPVSCQLQVLSTEVNDNCKNAKTATIRQRIRCELQ